MDKTNFTRLVREFRFKELFNQMGWDNASGSFQIELKGNTFTISVICEKSGFRFLQCTPPTGSVIPSKNDRLSIQSVVKRRYYEHLLIFTDDQRQKQIWQYAYKPAGKPIKTVITEYYVTQDPQLLFQRTKGLVFSIDEHENITLVDVTKRMNASVDQNSEKVTKKFYDGFKKQHTKFLSFMTGISDEVDKNWYTSVMLNRLMFCYFIQKRGFLDNNEHYLMNKLQDGQLVHGRDKFYSFYRSFLLQLFHNGLGSPDRERLSPEFGKIPYLNGGIFSMHELESKYEGQIQISDDAFESLFKFFEEFNWHLDTNITATGRDINPDVIGYIFEKYINDRAQMGAYYTKEDITDYIAKNTILPYLFDELQRKLPDAFKPDGEIWQKLKYSDDLYIYNAVKYGINSDHIWHDLPSDIAAGLNPEQDNLIELRRYWNRPAPNDIALPTEIWREVIGRRQRYLEVKQHITEGDILRINDFITYNLDIRQFTLDLIYETADPKLVYQFYKALKSITILDPTCGSGAFLFAAMNILEDLYEACINRMRDFVHDNPGHSSSHMKKELDIVDHPSHPNLEYFIYKSIILNNIYGVDIMNEAVEIAKLRLFLKLVACVDPDPKHTNYGLEPLPDIDFNIRCGNTLVGYANWEDIIKDIESDAISAAENKEIIPDMCQKVAMAFIQYKEIQLEGYQDYANFSIAKSELQDNLKSLNAHLDKMLYQHTSTMPYCQWKGTHQPFHWFAEFYEIIHDNNGFNIVIGNPPYVEFTKKSIYYNRNYFTCDSLNLFSLIVERSYSLSNEKALIGFILQLSSISTKNMYVFKEYLHKYSGLIYSSTYPERPHQLFSGACIAVTIQIISKSTRVKGQYSSGINRTTEDARRFLFENLNYIECPHYTDDVTYYHPKFKYGIENSIFSKIMKEPPIEYYLGIDQIDNRIYYRTAGGRYWKIFINRPFKTESTSNKSKSFNSDYDRDVFVAVLNSNLYWWFYCSFFDLYNLKDYMIFKFPFKYIDVSELKELAYRLITVYEQNCEIKEQYIQSKSKTNYSETFKPQLAKTVIDNIDSNLARHYGFSLEELDFLTSYDYKYRMSNVSNNDNDE